MKAASIAVAALGALALIALLVAVKTYQFSSCRSDGLSHGTCMAIISGR
jgi:hypothetical protein